MSISTEQIGSTPRGAELLAAMTGHAVGEDSDADAAAGRLGLGGDGGEWGKVMRRDHQSSAAGARP
jgi:hypothetical protein